MQRWCAKVRLPADRDECWLWTAAQDGRGYGRFKAVSYVSIPAYRFGYLALVGPIPKGLELDHLCRNRLCVNPLHLEPVTHAENTLRGESCFARQARQTHCKNGHPLSGSNLIIDADGCRRCRHCNIEWQRARSKRRKTA